VYELGEVPKTKANRKLAAIIQKAKKKLFNKAICYQGKDFFIKIFYSVENKFYCVIEEGETIKTIDLDLASVGPRKIYAVKSVKSIPEKKLADVDRLVKENNRISAYSISGEFLFAFAPEEKGAKLYDLDGVDYVTLEDYFKDKPSFNAAWLSQRFLNIKADFGRLKVWVLTSKNYLDHSYFDLSKAADVTALVILVTLGKGRKLCARNTPDNLSLTGPTAATPKPKKSSFRWITTKLMSWL
jgi:hypothetical protein